MGTVENGVYSVANNSIKTGLSTLRFVKDTAFSFVGLGDPSKSVSDSRSGSMIGKAKDMVKGIVPPNMMSQLSRTSAFTPLSAANQISKMPQLNQATLGSQLTNIRNLNINPSSSNDKGEFKGDVASLKISYDRVSSDPHVQQIKKDAMDLLHDYEHSKNEINVKTNKKKDISVEERKVDIEQLRMEARE